ncbi:MAG: VWA domain-containing protein [Betaproteobacteria bacterium]|nr:VWA domain-containing protein [Betaproteobacteria bacterium]MBI2961653.1 VWA domain-containing protein [Betaproteobacteria bacterium]
MTFLWPEALVLLAAIPLLAALYAAALRRKRSAALRYPGLERVRIAPGWSLRGHVPPLLLLLALGTLFIALARPAAVMRLPSRYETVILAMDVSGSMRATDVSPNRIGAAKEAAKAFVAEQRPATRIGVVAFSDTATLVQAPTRNREDILAAIERLAPLRATAIGSGILVALKAIFPDLEVDLGAGSLRGADGAAPGKPPLKPTAPGSYGSAVIILLTDGQNIAGPHPVEAARLAAERGVRVYTVGIGTDQGEIRLSDGWTMRVLLDEDTLKHIANITRAEYFNAGNALDLKKIYRTLNSRLATEGNEIEVTALFSAAASLLVLLSGLLSLLWFGRIL